MWTDDLSGFAGTLEFTRCWRQGKAHALAFVPILRMGIAPVVPLQTKPIAARMHSS